MIINDTISNPINIYSYARFTYELSSEITNPQPSFLEENKKYLVRLKYS